MPPSPAEKEFAAYIVDLMQSLGLVCARAMFGGYGIFHDGLMFGIIADNVLYLKVDQETESDFKDKGLEQFRYHKQGKELKMSYYQAPEEALDNAEEMHQWAAKAYRTALRAASKQQKKRKK